MMGAMMDDGYGGYGGGWGDRDIARNLSSENSILTRRTLFNIFFFYTQYGFV